MGIRRRNLILLIIGCFMLCHSHCSSMRTFLRQGESLQYPDQLFSKSRKFLLCFFDPIDEYSQNPNVFLGLFYNTKEFSSPDPVWVADRNAKFLDGSANLTLDNDGSLKILYEGGRSFVLYSSHASSNSSIVLQDDGNLVLRDFSSDGSSRKDLWQSFDHPTDTLLPGMRLGFNNKTKKILTVVSRGNRRDYRSGSYTLGVDPSKMNQLVIWWMGDLYWTSGSWKNGNFTSATALSSNGDVNFDYVSNENGTYFTFSPFEDIFNPRLTLDKYGSLTLITSGPQLPFLRHLVYCQHYYYENGPDEGCVEKLSECREREYYRYNTHRGITSSNGTKMSKDLTEVDCYLKCYYNCSCVAYGSINDTECVVWSRGSTFWEASVLDGDNIINILAFQGDFGAECGEKLPECGETKHFKQYYDSSPRIMSNNDTKMSKDLTWFDSQHKCDKNCSCIAYAFVNNTECWIWRRESTFRDASYLDVGQTINLKLKSPGDKRFKWIVLAFALGGAALFIMISWRCYVVARRWKRKAETKRKQKQLLREIGGDALPSSTQKTTQEQKTQHELQIFSFKTIVSATKNFSHENQLGKGGYGPVYKVKFLYTLRMDEDDTTTTIQIIMRLNFQGRLPNGQEIAIKRLSTSSTQGLVEFKKEAILIAKLQHTNLVRLLGFCVQGEEKALVYEYMPNKSLDFFLFESARKKILNWKKRFIIIEGIAQGLVYLHKYSRLKVIHRDLKASNILLDLEMNPKISDFGMARLLGPGDSEENTNRIVGTFGYMPPEYALEGVVSIKTDVFSFGILLLEIVSGRKNNNRYHLDHPLNLTGYAWTLWKEGNGVELIDPSLDESVPHDEVMKCIQVGLLCVQEQACNRPTMIDVVFMLSTENAQLPLPRKPAFFISSIEETPEEAQTRVEIFSINELTMSTMEVR